MHDLVNYFSVPDSVCYRNFWEFLFDGFVWVFFHATLFVLVHVSGDSHVRLESLVGLIDLDYFFHLDVERDNFVFWLGLVVESFVLDDTISRSSLPPRRRPANAPSLFSADAGAAT